MMTKSKKFLMLMLTLVVSVAGYAQTEIDGIKYNLNNATKEAEVTYGNDYSGDVSIPANVTCDGVKYKVTSVGDEAFNGNSLTSITIPETVTSIKYMAFANSRNLTSITIPNSVKNIGEAAFLSCI